MDEWRNKALAEIRGIKLFWISKYGWSPTVDERHPEYVDLYVTVTRRPRTGNAKPEKFVLRLRYQGDYEMAGRRESFVNPENFSEEGQQFWPAGVSGFNPGNAPPTICLEGTWGFHSHHHRERDGRRAQLNKLLMEIERCLNR